MDQAAEQTEKTAIIQDGWREKMLKKVDEVKATREVRVSAYKEVDRYFATVFVRLAWIYFQIDPKELKKFEKAEIEQLAEMMYEKTYKRAAFNLVLMLSIPVFGWATLLVQSDPKEGGTTAWSYRVRYRKLKNLYGKNYFPHTALLQRIKREEE